MQQGIPAAENLNLDMSVVHVEAKGIILRTVWWLINVHHKVKDGAESGVHPKRSPVRSLRLVIVAPTDDVLIQRMNVGSVYPIPTLRTFCHTMM
jgi:hypothetical protein